LSWKVGGQSAMTTGAVGAAVGAAVIKWSKIEESG